MTSIILYLALGSILATATREDMKLALRGNDKLFKFLFVVLVISTWPIYLTFAIAGIIGDKH